ncbi:ATP-binding cassette domain-containing protein [Bacillus sp. WMMC1349]|uniref:ATP-binding cassette domain-containing protein n=1 Tax=Bacillus sp. WMMC1349 TaxID=2736254 RepID=UPI001551BB93|nr:ATP-binding cassette domain-containing protein [Bacillus sp. WMMC1349]NPC91744.1 ATP-binding cassette domain-containing protein [Bacillus sp. WMMC1349]
MLDVIRVDQLTKTYNGLPVVKNLNLYIKQGMVFGLLGANGAGKSTTIECMLGTKKPIVEWLPFGYESIARTKTTSPKSKCSISRRFIMSHLVDMLATFRLKMSSS